MHQTRSVSRSLPSLLQNRCWQRMATHLRLVIFSRGVGEPAHVHGREVRWRERSSLPLGNRRCAPQMVINAPTSAIAQRAGIFRHRPSRIPITGDVTGAVTAAPHRHAIIPMASRPCCGKVILSLLGLAATITACPSSWIKEIVRGHEPAMTDMMVLRCAMMSFMDAHAPIPRTGIRRQPCVSESPRWGMPARGRCDSRWEQRHAVVERGGWRSPIRNAPCDAAHGAAPSQRMTSTRREWLRVRDNLPCG